MMVRVISEIKQVARKQATKILQEVLADGHHGGNGEETNALRVAFHCPFRLRGAPKRRYGATAAGQKHWNEREVFWLGGSLALPSLFVSIWARPPSSDFGGTSREAPSSVPVGAGDRRTGRPPNRVFAVWLAANRRVFRPFKAGGYNLVAVHPGRCPGLSWDGFQPCGLPALFASLPYVKVPAGTMDKAR